MARPLRLDIDSDASGARKGLDATARGVDRLGDNVKQLERSFISASGAAVVVGKRIDNIGDQARQSAWAVDELGDQLSQLGRKGLGAGAVAGLSVAVAKEGEKAATTFTSLFQGGLINAFKSLPPEAQGGIAAGVGGAVAVLGPFIGATIGAAVLGGVGTGGIIGGVVLAAQDARVKAAFTKFADVAKTTLTDSAGSFVDPLVEAAHLFTDSFRDPAVAGQLKEIFSDLSKAVGPLARGLAGLVKEALPGLRDAARAAVPLFQTLGRELPGLGKAASDFFSSVARGGPGAAHALQDILHVTEGILVVFGRWIEDASKVYEGLRLISGTAFIEETFGKAAAQAQVLGPALDDVAGGLSGVAVQGGAATDALDRLFRQSQDIIGATVSYEQALDDLQEQLKRNKGQWDANTQAGRDNITAFERAIQNAYDIRQSMIASGQSVAYADQQFQNMFYTVILMAKAAGATKQQIDFLTQAWRNLYQEPSDKTFTVRVRQVGSVSVQGVESGGEVRSSGTRAIARAGGGPVTAGRPYWVGESGPELLWPSGRGYITDTQQSKQLARAVAGTSTAPARAQTSYTLPPMSVIEQALAAVVMKLEQTGQLQRA
jgi:hypothetical protein